MKKNIFAFAVLTIGVLGCILLALSFYSPSSAQRKFQNQWEYAALTFTMVPFTSDNQATITAIANVCYLQLNGCQNEEVKAELVYARFLQEFRLENTSGSKSLAYNRAREIAYTKAVAKLGLEGWEMVNQSSVNFDTYIPEFQGTYTISQNSKDIKPNVYFKRMTAKNFNE